MSGWGNAGSFSSGFADGLRMVGSLTDIVNKRDDRKRMIAREAVKDKRDEDRFNALMRQYKDIHDAQARTAADWEASKDTRALKRKVDRLKLDRLSEKLGNQALFDKQTQADIAALDTTIDKSRKAKLALDLAKATQKYKIAEAAKNAKDDTGGKGKKTKATYQIPGTKTTIDMDQILQSYKVYRTNGGDKQLKEYIADLLSPAKSRGIVSSAGGNTPPEQIDLSSFFLGPQP